jgi:hypothetical protein
VAYHLRDCRAVVMRTVDNVEENQSSKRGILYEGMRGSAALRMYTR